MIDSLGNFSFRVGEEIMSLAFGFTYKSTFVAGSISLFTGFVLFAIQSHNKPDSQLTAMDSEKHARDQRALNYGQFLSDQSKTNHQKSLTEAKGVVIPIGDIEKTFSSQN